MYIKCKVIKRRSNIILTAICRYKEKKNSEFISLGNPARLATLIVASFYI